MNVTELKAIYAYNHMKLTRCDLERDVALHKKITQIPLYKEEGLYGIGIELKSGIKDLVFGNTTARNNPILATEAIQVYD